MWIGFGRRQSGQKFVGACMICKQYCVKSRHQRISTNR
jgi:hypothetical protein